MPTSSSAPPPRAGFNSRPSGFHSSRNPRSAFSSRSSPILPALIHSLTLTIAGMNRLHIASIRKRFFSRANATSSASSPLFTVKGFSQSTAFPALSASMAFSLWNGCGVPI
ncbi:hypothetical protein D3C73_1441310 [compost metagenome]